LTAFRYALFLSASLIGFSYDLIDEAAKVLKTINNQQRDNCKQPLPTRQPLETPHIILISRFFWNGRLTRTAALSLPTATRSS
jgi:hypothetical protein